MADHRLPRRNAKQGFQDLTSPQNPVSTATSPVKPADATTVEDPEFEKRKARAARFGIPLVDSNQPTPVNRNPKGKFEEVCVNLVQPLTVAIMLCHRTN